MSRSVRKGEMVPLHRLLFWFIIKNVIPWGQGQNLADPMDMCLTDLLDRGEKINLPAIMINHFRRIANTSKNHDMDYGLLLTSVFEQMGIPLQKRVSLHITDELGGSYPDWVWFSSEERWECQLRTRGPNTSPPCSQWGLNLQHSHTKHSYAGPALPEGRNCRHEEGTRRRKGSQRQTSWGSSECHLCPHGQILFSFFFPYLILTFSSFLFPFATYFVVRSSCYCMNNGGLWLFPGWLIHFCHNPCLFMC